MMKDFFTELGYISAYTFTVTAGHFSEFYAD